MCKREQRYVFTACVLNVLRFFSEILRLCCSVSAPAFAPRVSVVHWRFASLLMLHVMQISIIIVSHRERLSCSKFCMYALCVLLVSSFFIALCSVGMNMLVTLLLFVVVNGLYLTRKRRRLQELEEELGPGRGRVQRAPEEHVEPVDVFGIWAQRPPRARDRSFRGATRLSYTQFLHLLGEVGGAIEQNRHVRMHISEPTGQLRSAKLTTPNRLLLTLKFLTCGTSGEELSAEFGWSEPAVSEDLRHVVYALAETIAYEIQWPGPEAREVLSAVIGPQFGNAFGTTDHTFTPTFRLKGDWSGHRHGPVRSTQLACDSLGYIVWVVAGQIGARHDAFNYQRSNLPDLLRACDSRLLADAGYDGCGAELITPAAARRLALPAEQDLYAELHTSRRSRIEQYIGVLKALFRVVGKRWQRSDREFLSVCIVVACMLYNRVRRL